MRTFALSITLLLAGLSMSVGQSFYKSGFILNSPFDTLRGEIKYRSYNKASLQCIFRDSLGYETNYSPGDIFGYGIEDQLVFVSKEIGKDRMQFLEVVYQGTLILYAYRDARAKNFFYLENPTTSQFELLTQKTIRNGRKSIVIRAFEEVLKEMLPKSELVEDKIKNVDYDHNALSNFLLEYDERYASFQGRIFKGYQKKWPPRIAPFLQSGTSQLTQNGFSESASSSTFGGGIKFQKEISRGTGRLHLDLDLIYHYESFENITFVEDQFAFPESIISNGYNIAIFALDLGVQGPYTIQNTINLERHVLSAPLNLKYFFPSEKWTFSLNGGIHPSLTLSQNGNIDGQVIQNDAVILGVNSQYDVNKFRPGLNIGAGIYLKTKGTWFFDIQHSPAWLDQGNSNFSFLSARLGYLFQN